MDPGGVELSPGVGDVVVDAAQGQLQAGELQCGDFVARRRFDTVEVMVRGREVAHGRAPVGSAAGERGGRLQARIGRDGVGPALDIEEAPGCRLNSCPRPLAKKPPSGRVKPEAATLRAPAAAVSAFSQANL